MRSHRDSFADVAAEDSDNSQDQPIPYYDHNPYQPPQYTLPPPAPMEHPMMMQPRDVHPNYGTTMQQYPKHPEPMWPPTQDTFLPMENAEYHMTSHHQPQQQHHHHHHHHHHQQQQQQQQQQHQQHCQEEMIFPTTGPPPPMIDPPAPAPTTLGNQLPQQSPIKTTAHLTTKKTTSKQRGNTSRLNSRDSSTTYILRIHEMLEDAENEGNQSIVSWQPHGRAFRIHNEEMFVQHILPRYFSAKIGSFRRWLRAWGFCRHTEGKDRGAWYHRYFVRGVTQFCKGLSRQEMAQAMANWPPAGQVPDFYCAASDSILSEKVASRLVTPNPTKAATSKNPKLLRGTVLEDLRQVLDDAERENFTDIVSWQPHGRAWKVHNKESFEDLMPRYFRTNKLIHLNDTLRIWGFRRLKTDGADKGCYYHSKFVRGNASLCRHLTRQKMKDSMANFPPPEGEPNLYQTPPSPVHLETEGDITSLEPDQNSEEVAQFSQAEPEVFFQDFTDPAESATLPQDNDATFSATFQQNHGNDAEELSPEHPPDERDEVTGSNTYVLRLHEMLEETAKKGNQDIVSWQPHGRAFRIHKEKEFVADIMPRYFKAQLKSFLRWCRAWGFVRMTEGKDRGAWYHRYFVRGVVRLCKHLSRQQMFDAMVDWLPAGHVPDFYSSGSDGILSEARITVQPARNVTCKNPKRLRGTVPEDLRGMLFDAEQENLLRVVSWCPHGMAFRVHDKRKFTELILPRYFKASKFTYFSDALRMWGWRRLKQGPDKGAYYHKLFVRNKPQLTRHLTRQQMNSSMLPWPPHGGEPDLYRPRADDTVDKTSQDEVSQTSMALNDAFGGCNNSTGENKTSADEDLEDLVL